MIQPVILCGGDGTRLWPASRKALPKQFMPLQEATLFERTLARAAAIPGAAPALVLCNQEHRFLAAAQAQTWGEGKSQGATGAIILEPCGRNTAPAAAVAALHCAATDPVLLVLPADHAIADIQGFVTAVLQALPAAEAGELVTFGVTPTGPETGYGYIQCGTVLSTTGVKGVLRVQQFIEKPSATRAASFLAAGAVHRLTNPGKVLLEIIEIQTGSYLGEDDIVRLEDQYGRSKVPDELPLELVRQIGLAFTAEFSPKTVCIGYDMRLSSKDIALVLASGLQDGGAEVINIGLCGTEEIYHATFSQGFDGGIMITASHNPKDWNGMKMVLADAVPVSSDSGLFALRDRILKGDLPLAPARGGYREQGFRAQYVQHLLTCLGEEAQKLAPLTIVANAGNGMAWVTVKELAKHLPCRIIPLHETPDGTFPNGVPNPLLPENRAETSKAVLAHKADFGIAWDGDFDRCFFFDEKGAFIEGYYLVGLLAEALLATHPGSKIIHDPRLVWNTQEIVTEAGGIAVETKAGHAFIKERMRAENALYGGEMSAHHYFRDFSYCDSGMLAWLLLYSLLGRKGQPLSTLVEDRMRRYPASGEINRAINNPDAAIKRIEAAYAPQAKRVTYVDGLSMEFADWRCNIRKSNTEPVLRLNVESRGNQAMMEEKRDALLALMV
ncbi:hypothetical protein B566_EDAN019317 [Ephemera danica]|nr:hypothetical protein B566_EDAN019317 [Ephemera danica]